MYGNSYPEQVGMRLQISSKSIAQAEKRLEQSCAAICGGRNFCSDCKRCGVFRTHQRVVSDFMDREEALERKFVEAYRIARATGCTVVVV